MSENNSLSYPQLTTADECWRWLKVLVGCGTSILGPAGPMIQSGIERFIPSPVDARREEFFDQLAAGLKQLQDRKQIDLPSLLTDPQFQTAAIEAAGIAIKNHSKVKLDALRNAVLNCARFKADDDSKRRTFMRFIDELSEGHIAILQLFQSPADWFRKANLKSPQYHSISSISGLINDAHPGLANQKDFCRYLLTDLKDRGLTDTDAQSLNVMMSASGAFAKRTTEFGDEFLTFISTTVT